MTVGSDQNLANAFAVTANNPQVTRIGKVLRDLKIDELPQLWNIVRGEMRLIGPRPIAQALHQRLCEEIPGFARRLDVKPGLTNLGQVCIYDNAEGEQLIQDWTRRLEADLHYIRHQSFWYDIVMLVMTALFVARKLVRRVLPAKSTPKPVAQREPISAPAAKAS